MSISTEITRIEGLVADSLAAVADKGVTVADGTKLANLPTLIASIEAGGTSGTSQFYLNKCVLTLDDGYQIERIPISAGDVIDLGSGEDVEASTNWGSYYHGKSHPAMTFQSWSSSIAITNNEFVVPDDISTDYHVGAIYVTSDGLNHYIEFDSPTGFSHRSDSDSSVIEGGTTVASASQKLTACWLGDNVTSLGSYAFTGCYSLTSVNIPDGVTSLSTAAFSDCYSLTSVNIPDSVTSLGIVAFSDCYSLTSVNIPDSVTSLGSYAFNGCYSLTSVNIPDSVTSLGSYAFTFCYSLPSINIPDSVTSIGNRAFTDCYSLTSVNIPDGVTSLGSYAFTGCYSLTSVNIPDGVTSLGSYAFNGCYSLTSMILNSSTPPTLGDTSAFNNCNCTFLVPVGSIDTYESATNWSSFTGRFIENTEANRKLFGIW